jgi:hypothetical protein
LNNEIELSTEIRDLRESLQTEVKKIIEKSIQKTYPDLVR